MDVPVAAIPEWLDLSAIAVGAGLTTLVASNLREKRLDWLGVIVIGIAVGLGGGMIRDVLIGIRPAAIAQSSYLLTAVPAAFAGMLLQRIMGLRGANTMIAVLDALSLGVFCAVGTMKAVAFGLEPVPAILLGTITAAGGGVVRDLLLGLPVGIMFAGSLYAVAATSGAAALLGAGAIGLGPWWSVAICIALTFLIRMASVIWGLSLPEQMSLRFPTRTRPGTADGVPLTDEEFVRATGFHSPGTSPIAIITAEHEAHARRDATTGGGVGTDAP